MKMKVGISLVTLVITIVVMVIITGVAILGTNNIIKEAEKEDFITELTTIKDKAKEYYLLMGNLPVTVGVEYTAEQVKQKLADSYAQTLLTNEISLNKDENNKFYVVNLGLLGLKTIQRGKLIDETDIFIIASNTLNVYYLKGFEVGDVLRFSTATLLTQNIIDENNETPGTEVDIDTQLSLYKDTNAWTKELTVTIKNNLQEGETLKYSIAGQTSVDVSNNKITINLDNMTSLEKDAFQTNKILTVNKLLNGVVIESKAIAIDNLDITKPSLGTLEMIDTSSAEYNVIKVNSTDQGGSEIKAIYYDYNRVIIDENEQLYYLDRSEVSTDSLIKFRNNKQRWKYNS